MRSRQALLAELARTALQLLIVGLALYLVWELLSRIWLVTVAVLAALLFTALLQPAADRLRRWHLPRWLATVAALLGGFVLLLTPLALAGSRAAGQVPALASNLQQGLGQARSLLVDGPAHLAPAQVDDLVRQAQDALGQAARSTFGQPLSAVTNVLSLLAGVILAIFILFFLMYDGQRVWQWMVGLWPADRRSVVEAAGGAAWTTLVGYVHGVLAVALIDGVLIGLGLLLLGVPLALSLAALTFIGAFVPLIGATVSGLLAVAVAFLSGGLTTAAFVLLLVLGVQQVEGNLLQPLIMRRAVNLHPLATLLAVAAGSLLAGIVGAVLAVPAVAVTRAALAALRHDLASKGDG
ncbi:MAG: AI-2E family transporter [Mycobacteriales bacterium]